MKKQTQQQAILHQLCSLANQPEEQAHYALEVLERERGTQVASEALAILTNAPVQQGRPLLRRLKEGACLPFIETFLCETQRYDIYHYVLTMIIAHHSPQAWKLLLKEAQDEQEPEKMQRLLSALTLMPHDPAIENMRRALQQKIAPEKR